MSQMELTVREVEHPVPDVLVAELEPRGGGILPEWLPGAHVELDLGNGLIRHYSLCGDPRDRSAWRIAVLLRADGAGGSARVHEAFAPGHAVLARAVRNRMRLPDADRVFFLAGGIGITPLLPMIRAAQARGVDWNLVYAGRRRDRMYALEELIDAFGPRVAPHFSGVHGRLSVEDLISGADGLQAIVCCGPASLMSAAQAVADRAGVEFVMEAFTTESAHDPDPAAALAGEGEFTVSLARTGIDVRVKADESVLEALEGAGMVIASSCREGYCGTCETVVLDGPVDHRDTVLTPEEHADTDLMMVCVSRCRGERLVLDL